MDDVPLLTCPRCGARGHFHRASIQDNSGCAMFLLGGLLAYLLSQSRNENMYICDRCHFVFKSDPPMQRGVLLFIAMICLLLALGIALVFVMGH